MARFGLIGTITHDFITYESGRTFEGLGGVLYQAAVFCGLGAEVALYTNLGRDLLGRVEPFFSDWPTLGRRGVEIVSGPGNRVRLFYPETGERAEILESVMPPLDPGKALADLAGFNMLVLVVNSAFDVKLEDWRAIVERAECPIWLDVHSLPLARVVGKRRDYLALPEWKEWTRGVDYVQANRQEVASMLGHPGYFPSGAELAQFAGRAFAIGVKALFLTLAKEGVTVMTAQGDERVSPARGGTVVDSTGCGDVFCSGTAVRLCAGDSVFEAARFGVDLASEAIHISGIRETFELAKKSKDRVGGKG